MSVAWRNGVVSLDGRCGVEDAEALLRALLDHPGAVVDWRQCTQAHAAVIQVLLAARVVPTGTPENRALAELVAPALRRGNPSAH